MELRQLQQRLGITTIVVTHDQREAMTMADLVVVMGKGRIRQAAAPVEIYRKPADAFVADFIGSTNLLPLTVDGRGQIGVLGARRCRAWRCPPAAARRTVSIRPEDVHLVGRRSCGDYRRPVTLRARSRRHASRPSSTLTAPTMIGGGNAARAARASSTATRVGIVLPPERCVVLAP